MLVNDVELTMSHVGLGTLTEYGIMTLFGTMTSKRLARETESKPDQITDINGNIIYPAYFMTHLKVPSTSLLSSYKLWDLVNIEVGLRRYGKSLLESKCVLWKKGRDKKENDEGDEVSHPTMVGASAIVIEKEIKDEEEREITILNEKDIRNIPALKSPPEAINRSNLIRKTGFVEDWAAQRIKYRNRISYKLMPGRDVSYGHNVMFAKYCDVMDYAEYVLFCEQIEPGFPIDVMRYLSVLERETYYYSNCHTNDRIDVFISADIKPCSSNYHGESMKYYSVLLFDIVVDIYKNSSNKLVTSSRVIKLLTVPVKKRNMLYEVERIISKLSRVNNEEEEWHERTYQDSHKTR